ncbi:MAG: hypothetical protein DGJ47_001024 [Rickettsiaceae bacterium]
MFFLEGPGKVKALCRLMRLHAPTGYLIPFFTACYGLVLGYEKMSDFWYIPLFFIGSVVTRGAGCVINDICDVDIDRVVERTKMRPLASGEISKIEAWVFLVVLSCSSLMILLTLPANAIYTGIFSAMMIVAYPIMKRITYYPQIFLGFAYNTSCLIGYAAVQSSLSFDILLLYVGCVIWTMAYDTLYGFSDMEGDRKIGAKSMAMAIEHMNYQAIIIGLYLLFLFIFTFVFYAKLNIAGIILITIWAFIMIWAVIDMDVRQKNHCISHFELNKDLAFFLFLAILLEKI